MGNWFKNNALFKKYIATPAEEVPVYDEATLREPKIFEHVMAYAFYSYNNNGHNYVKLKHQLMSMTPSRCNESQADWIIEAHKEWHRNDARLKSLEVLKTKTQELINQKAYSESYGLLYQAFVDDIENLQIIDLFYEVGKMFKPLAEVVQDLDGLAEQFPEQADNLRYRKGMAYKFSAVYESAIQVFESLTKDRDFAWDYYQIAIVHNLMGSTEDCIINLKKAFELDPRLKDDARHYHELANLVGNEVFTELTR